MYSLWTAGSVSLISPSFVHSSALFSGEISLLRKAVSRDGISYEGKRVWQKFSWSSMFVLLELPPVLSPLLFCMTCSRYQRSDLLSLRGGMSALLCLPLSLLSLSLALSEIVATREKLSFPLTRRLRCANSSEHQCATNHSAHFNYNIKWLRNG